MRTADVNMMMYGGDGIKPNKEVAARQSSSQSGRRSGRGEEGSEQLGREGEREREVCSARHFCETKAAASMVPAVEVDGRKENERAAAAAPAQRCS